MERERPKCLLNMCCCLFGFILSFASSLSSHSFVHPSSVLTPGTWINQQEQRDTKVTFSSTHHLSLHSISNLLKKITFFQFWPTKKRKEKEEIFFPIHPKLPKIFPHNSHPSDPTPTSHKASSFSQKKHRFSCLNQSLSLSVSQ